MKFTTVLTAVIIYALSTLVIAENVPEVGAARTRRPLLDGGFWQLGPGLLKRMSDEDLAAEVGHMRRLGMNVIIIQYSVLPVWREGQEDYVAYVPNAVYPVHEAFQRRDPFGAIFKAADEEGVRVYLGGMLIKKPFKDEYRENVERWASPQALKFRREIINRFSSHPSLAGFYCPNEPNPAVFLRESLDPMIMLRATKKVTAFVKSVNPELEIIKCIGLYLEPDGEGGHKLATKEYLNAFWRPFVSRLNDVDVWMVIDGVGTRLSNLEHTGMAQKWASELAREFGKSYWTDVENARMGYEDGKYQAESFTMNKLEKSLRIAAKYADRIVTFDYAHYMSRRSHREKARRLHEDYRRYREKLKE